MTTLMTSPVLDSNNTPMFTADQKVMPTECAWCRGTGQVTTSVLEHGVVGMTTCQHCGGNGQIAPKSVPHTSVVEAAGWLIIDLEMPSVVARDLDVVIDGRWVTIKSLPRVDAPITPVRISRDRMQPPVERIIELPQLIDLQRSDAIKATLLDGVLRLVLPIQRKAATNSSELNS
ncbi:MAG: Hsp20 family protein [Planctomycetota bacterium]|nr:Hsp20 family protein [Planctomycetota bacterium]